LDISYWLLLTVGSDDGVGTLKTELVDEEATTAADEDVDCLFTLTTSPTTTEAAHNSKMEIRSFMLSYRSGT
jgi:hypothetical protein